ncbi:alpha/beta fold hydrolase [Candidatus Woesearchaeota archaeon]|nr:MAG: alpha/beta fold hydrolase [Candidatus Woesearchaeota archaeon]
MKGADPVFIKRGRIGVLMFHGFTSTPQEMHYLADFLAKNNYSVAIPLLKGHGTDARDLARTKVKDWLDSVMPAYLELRKHCDKIFLGGSSFGANLAVILSQKIKVDGLLLLAMPAYFRREKTIRRALPFLSIIKRIRPFPKKPYLGQYEHIYKKKLHYDVFPLNCAKDVINTIALSRKLLPKIHVPTLVMQSDSDHQITKENAVFIYNHLGTKHKHLFFVPNAYHVFIMDKNRNMAFKEINNFIKKYGAEK